MTTYHWLVLFVVVNVADAALTLYGIRLGAYEANPLLRALIRLMPALAALLVIKGAYVVAVCLLPAVAPWLPWLTAFFVAVCAWNVVQIRALRRV